MVTAAKVAFDLDSPNSPNKLFGFEYKIQKSISPSCFRYQLGQEILIDALYEPPGLIITELLELEGAAGALIQSPPKARSLRAGGF